jgi:hypothetical protein
MKIKQAPKYKFGQTFSRDGKCQVKVCGFTHAGEYILCKMLRAVSGSSLAEHFHPSEMVEGATLILSGNRKRLLLLERDTGFWEWTNPDDLIILKEEDLDQLKAEAEVRFLPGEVARMHHPERQSRANRYAPKNAK